jgi:hypothetical protein
MNKVTRNLKRRFDGVERVEVSYPGGVPKYKSILTEEDRRQIEEVKRLVGDRS